MPGYPIRASARRRPALLTGAFAALALLAGLALAPADARAARSPLPIGSRLYDLGVADIDHDGRLDVFGTSHENAARSLLSRGRAGFRAASGALGFGEDGTFPGLGNTRRRPDEKAPGTYIYVHRVDEGEKDLYVRVDAHHAEARVGLTLSPERNVKDVRVRGGSARRRSSTATTAPVSTSSSAATAGPASASTSTCRLRCTRRARPSSARTRCPPPSEDFSLRLADTTRTSSPTSTATAKTTCSGLWAGSAAASPNRGCAAASTTSPGAGRAIVMPGSSCRWTRTTAAGAREPRSTSTATGRPTSSRAAPAAAGASRRGRSCSWPSRAAGSCVRPFPCAARSTAG